MTLKIKTFVAKKLIEIDKKKKSYDYYGWKVSTKDVMWRDLLGREMDITNEDHRVVKKIIKKYIPYPRTALDIGCHYGFFTKFLATKFNHVHAFDFDNEVFPLFKENMERFAVKNLTMHPYGLGDKNTKVAIKDWYVRWQRKNIKPGREPRLMWSRRALLSNHVDPEGVVKKHNIKTLDSLNIKDIDLIVMDTEGYELFVLKGGIETIKKYKPVLIIEFHNTKKLTRKYGYELVEQEKFLQELGYEFVCNINKVDRVFVPVCINNLQY